MYYGEVSRPPPSDGRCGGRREARTQGPHARPAGMARQLCGAAAVWDGAEPGGGGRPALARRVDRGAGDERAPSCPPVPRWDGAGTREVAATPVLGRLALGRHCAEGEAHGRGGGRGQRGLWECRGAEGMRPARGGPREQEPPGGRQAGRGGGAPAGAVPLERLALVFPVPRAPSTASYPPCGVGAAPEVTPKRGVAPAARPSALRMPRQGWAPEAAPSAPSAERRLLSGGRACSAWARAGRCGCSRRASCLPGAAWRRKTGGLARPTTQARRCRGARPALTSGGAPWRAPRTKRGGRGQGRRRQARRRPKRSACSVPGGRVPGRRPAVTNAPLEPCTAPQRPRAGMRRIMDVERACLRPLGRIVRGIEVEPKGRRRRRGAGAAGGHPGLGPPRAILTVHAGCTPRAGRRTRQGLRWSQGEARHAPLQARRAPAAVGRLAGGRAGSALREPWGPEGAQGLLHAGPGASHGWRPRGVRGGPAGARCRAVRGPHQPRPRRLPHHRPGP